MMSSLLRVFDPDATDEETRRLSRLAQKCWAPMTIIYNPLKAGSIDSTDTIPHDRAIVRAQNADFVPSKDIKGRPECTVFVGNLSKSTSSRSLEDEFKRYGRIVKVTVVEDIITGRSRGYGFVEFANEGDATNAYEYANKTWLDGNKIFVDMECGRTLPGWVPRRLGGGFNGRKESGQLRFGCRERVFRKPIKFMTEREIKQYFEVVSGKKRQKGDKRKVSDEEESRKEENSGESKDMALRGEVEDREKRSPDREERNRTREDRGYHRSQSRREFNKNEEENTRKSREGNCEVEDSRKKILSTSIETKEVSESSSEYRKKNKEERVRMREEDGRTGEDRTKRSKKKKKKRSRERSSKEERKSKKRHKERKTSGSEGSSMD